MEARIRWGWWVSSLVFDIRRSIVESRSMICNKNYIDLHDISKVEQNVIASCSGPQFIFRWFYWLALKRSFHRCSTDSWPLQPLISAISLIFLPTSPWSIIWALAPFALGLKSLVVEGVCLWFQEKIGSQKMTYLVRTWSPQTKIDTSGEHGISIHHQ